MIPRRSREDILDTLLLAATYVVAAQVGLLFAPVAGFASLVWAPSGIALAALLLHGLRLAPGIALGAMIANALAGASIPTAFVIGLGNAAGALAGAAALRRLRFDVELHDTRSALRLVGTSVATAMIPATVGASVLVLSGTGDRAWADIWLAWWIGDAIGNLLIAPLVLVWATRRAHHVAASRRLEFVVALAVCAAASVAIFVLQILGAGRPAAYLMSPPLIWAAVRFGPRGAVTAVSVSAVIAIYGTVSQRGPFVREDLETSLLMLQVFVGVTLATFLVLGAAIAERRRAELSLERARAQAEEANRAKAEFLAVMSHELRTPLNAISGFVDLMLMGAQGPLSATQRSSVERIQRNQYHLLALINDLLAFTKLEAGKVRLEIAPIRVSDAMDHAEHLIQPELRRKQLAFTRHLGDESLTVLADCDKLAQVLLNLLSNAAKYTDTGGTVTMGVEPNGERARIWVADTGIGIPADQLDKVFHPFFQVDRGRTRRYGGVGLGLTIARDLARAMGGDVAIDSRAGEGTTVSLYLPMT